VSLPEKEAHFAPGLPGRGGEYPGGYTEEGSAMAGPSRGRSPRDQEKRKEKLAEIKRQVADGSLVIRKMTATERKRNPAADGSRRKSKSGRGR
jgi:hypothetical protein